jgi:hypothetical protein
MEVIKKKYSTCYLFEALNDERYDKLKVFFVCQKKGNFYIYFLIKPMKKRIYIVIENLSDPEGNVI